MSGAIVVFARAPELGRVKTRLEPALGAARTFDLYRAFLADTLESARRTGARVYLAHTSAEPPEAAGADASFPQQGDSFGARFDAALAETRSRMEGPIVLIGADSPHLGTPLLREALDILVAPGRDAVLGPSTEGGFYLLGFRERPPPVSAAFDEPNEAAAVARLTSPTLMAPHFDIDVPSDLVNLILYAETQSAAGAWTPPRTMAALAKMGARVVSTREVGARGRLLVVDT